VDAVVDPLALSLLSHVPFHTAKGFTLSMAKQVWNGKMDDVIESIERTVRLPPVVPIDGWLYLCSYSRRL
jgi:pyruvate dehydrogenase (quinone)